ncbi:MAG: diguanylate cyclase [Bradyrhizobiaceae bacterium]|nr:MAG: diguanylate cyclase [Bradyrhizobiaceae bacterium]
MISRADVRGATSACRAALLDAILHSLPVGVTVTAGDGRLILANEAAADPAPRGGTGKILRAADGRALMVADRRVEALGERLTVTAAVDITDRVRTEEELLRRVSYDELTGLPTRRLVQAHVEDALARARSGERLALAFIDIDNFKHINDFYSHAAGDALLAEFARRIVAPLRATDMAARISGDEFVLVLDPIAGAEDLVEAVHGLTERLAQPFYIEGFEIFASASLGVSIYPDHGGDYETLRRNADSAMYRAKEGRRGAVFFDLAMGRALTARMELEQRLRLAIRDQQFFCAFQPKVDIRTCEVIGLEALVRWRDGHGEIQGPASFISLAIELGLIDEITHQVLAQATAALDTINDAFGPDTTVSINIAARQADNPVFMRSFIAALRATERPHRFMLEVTEDAFMAKGRFQAEILPLLREIGVGVSIDDFGTGYSSLSALADITADEIKIDRSFITDIHLRPRSQSVLKAIESLGTALGMTMIAEGVETFEELAYLQAATRIRYAQGYYFSKPIFLEDAGGRAFDALASRAGADEGRRAPLSSRGPQANRARISGRS